MSSKFTYHPRPIMDERRKAMLIKIVEWAQKQGKDIRTLTKEDINEAIKSKF